MIHVASQILGANPVPTRYPSQNLKTERPISVKYGWLFPVRNYDTDSSFNWVNLCDVSSEVSEEEDLKCK